MLAVVPARGNSKEVKRKNLQVVDGKPLLCHIADTLKGMGIRVVVSTEDVEVASVAKVHGYEVHDRSPELSEDDVPVADVAAAVIEDLDYSGPVIIAQPTCPFVTKETLGRLINDYPNSATTLAAKQPHVLRRDPDGQGRSKRLEGFVPANRQYMIGMWREVGVRYFPKGSDFDGEPAEHVHVSGREAFDIDTIHELRAAQTTRRTIEFAVSGNEKIGTGHVKRCLDLANELQHHDIFFTVHDSEDWVDDWIRESGWLPYHTDTDDTANLNSDLVIIDQLDITTEQVAGYKANGSKVVTIEDQGTGVWDADLTINALYLGVWQRGDGWSNMVVGPKWADLRPEFVGLPKYNVWDSKRVLVMFGGTDPSGLGERVQKWVPPYGDVTWVKPGDKVNVAWEMMNHDVLITSAGRTVYEAAAVGIPTIVIAQNARETQHAHLGYGNLYLGVGTVVTDEQIVETVDRLLGDHDLRQELSDISRASVDGKGLQRIAWAVEGLLRGM